VTRRHAFPSAIAPIRGPIDVSQIAEARKDRAELLKTPTIGLDDAFRITAVCCRGFERLDRLPGDVDDVRGCAWRRLVEKAQDRSTNRCDEFLRCGDRLGGFFVCKQLKPPPSLRDGRKVFGTRYRERADTRSGRAEDAIREDETVALRSLHEEVDFRRSYFADQRSQRVAEPVDLLRIALIDAGDVAAKLRSARSLRPAGILAYVMSTL
jgi:hypothetical protein